MSGCRIQSTTRLKRGLTLQEMVVVVCVFVVLACILILSSNQVIVRSRVSRVRQEQQMISSAIEAFRLDNSRYPTVLSRMIRPTGLLNDVPVDPFRIATQSAYTYYCLPSPTGQRRQAIIVSAGPDGDVDFFPPQWIATAPAPTPSEENPDEPAVAAASSSSYASHPNEMDPLLKEIILRTYDPTNGINSDGDIIKLNYN